MTKLNKVSTLQEGDKVSFELGVTLNMGDYNSVRVMSSVETTVQEGETALEAYRRIKTFVERRVNEEVTEYKNNK